jgi:hypothetical protein
MGRGATMTLTQAANRERAYLRTFARCARALGARTAFVDPLQREGAAAVAPLNPRESP